MTRSKWIDGDGDWANAADWSHGIPDGADATAVIKDRHSPTVTIAEGESFTVDRLHVENSNRLDVSGQLNFHRLIIDPNGFVMFKSSRTFDNGTIQFGAGINVLRFAKSGSGYDVMTLGPHETLRSVGGTNAVVCDVVNQGLISAVGGGLYLEGMVTNDSVISASSGALLNLFAALSGSGEVNLSTGGTLDANQVASSQTVQFPDGSGVLNLGEPSAFAGTLEGFQAGDTVDLQFTVATSVSLNDQDVLTIKNGSTVVATFQLIGSYRQSDFNLSSDGVDGTLLTTSHAPAAAAVFAQSMAARAPATSAPHAGFSSRALADQHISMALPRP